LVNLSLKVTQFKDEAQKWSVSIETVRCTFERDLDKGLILGIIAPDKSEAICFEPNDVEALTAELSCGRISLANLGEQLNLTIYQVRLVLQHLLKNNRIEGELTYSTFISKATAKKTLLQKAKEHKRIHRLKLRK
jgi:hypothetical protein